MTHLLNIGSGEVPLKFVHPKVDRTKDENIGNYRYIGTSILWIYRIYRRHIDGYFDTKYQ